MRLSLGSDAETAGKAVTACAMAVSAAAPPPPAAVPTAVPAAAPVGAPVIIIVFKAAMASAVYRCRCRKARTMTLLLQSRTHQRTSRSPPRRRYRALPPRCTRRCSSPSDRRPFPSPSHYRPWCGCIRTRARDLHLDIGAEGESGGNATSTLVGVSAAAFGASLTF